jgi:hypothetical protein
MEHVVSVILKQPGRLLSYEQFTERGKARLHQTEPPNASPGYANSRIGIPGISRQ